MVFSLGRRVGEGCTFPGGKLAGHDWRAEKRSVICRRVGQRDEQNHPILWRQCL